jgi:hypothetical protein
MRFIHLTIPSDFIQVLNILRKNPTKNGFFCMRILFTTIYLLYKQKFNPSIYYKKELIMKLFV